MCITDTNMIIICSLCVFETDIKGVGYRHADEAALQSISWYDGEQSRKKHHQVSKELQADGQPSVEKTSHMHINRSFIITLENTSGEYHAWMRCCFVFLRYTWCSISDLFDTIHG